MTILIFKFLHVDYEKYKYCLKIKDTIMKKSILLKIKQIMHYVLKFSKFFSCLNI